MNDVADELLAAMGGSVDGGETAERTLETLSDAPRPVRDEDRSSPRSEGHAGHGRPTSAAELGVRGYSALRRVLSFAVRRGYIATNPPRSSNAAERPKPRTADVRVLLTTELGRSSRTRHGTTRALVQTAALSGLRQSELLALRWSGRGLRCRPTARPLSVVARDGLEALRLVSLKTDKSARDVVLSEPLAAVLREHRKRQLRAA